MVEVKRVYALAQGVTQWSSKFQSLNGANPTADDDLDWGALAKILKAGSASEAKKRAYEIAKFVGDVSNDKDSELILATGGKKVALTLNQ